MSFKEDWSFLDKITMGAIGTRTVIDKLNESGHRIIELERYSTSNKIWSTKIKRLRIPDLLCLKCGKRIESRAKSKLGIIMSDAATNPDRRWFSGLRDEDLVAFIQCYKNDHQHWETHGIVNLFSVSSLKATEDKTSLSAPKSVSEGAERDRTWSNYVPSYDFTVVEIEQEDDGLRLRMQNGNNKRRSTKIPPDKFLYVSRGDSYPANTKIVASIVDSEIDHRCSEHAYNFVIDLLATEKETVYTAIKALGYLDRTEEAINALTRIATDESIDKRLRLEAYSSLLRLGEDAWNNFESFALSSPEKEIKMEFVLILGELGHHDQTLRILNSISVNTSFEDELRAAAIWSLSNDEAALLCVLNSCFDPCDVISNHAISKIENHFIPQLTGPIIQKMNNSNNNCIIGARLLSKCANVDAEAVVNAYLVSTNDTIKNWLLYSMGLAGREKYEQVIIQLDAQSEETIKKLQLVWDNEPIYLDKDRLDSIEFIKLQQ
ncbi:MAG: hypothetical protein ABFC94_00185 [Syntrophomonas sp.]